MFKQVLQYFTKITFGSVRLFCLFFVLYPSVQAQDIVKVEKISGFNSLSVMAGINAYLTQDSVEKITIIGPQDLVNDVTISKEAGNLKLEMASYMLQNWKWDTLEPLKILISFKTLSQININNGAGVYASSELKFDNLIINADDASDCKLDITANKLSVTLKNGSDIRLAGKTTLFTIEATNGCLVKTFGLMADTINAIISTRSVAQLHPLQALKVHAQNQSLVQYKADTKLIKSVRTSGASSINKAKKDTLNTP
jgi:hypothetical protein